MVVVAFGIGVQLQDPSFMLRKKTAKDDAGDNAAGERYDEAADDKDEDERGRLWVNAAEHDVEFWPY